MSTVNGEMNGENTLAMTEETAMRGNSVGLSGKGDVNGVQAEGGANGVYTPRVRGGVVLWASARVRPAASACMVRTLLEEQVW